MKRKIIIILTVSIVVSLGSVLAFSILHQAEVKTHPQESDSRLQSRQFNFHIADLIPDKKKIKLKLRKGFIVLDTAWVEYSWYFEPNYFVTTKEKLDISWYNLCLKAKAVGIGPFEWGFEFRDKKIGTIGGYDLRMNQQNSSLYLIPDTLVIFLTERHLSSDIGWKKPIVTDTIIYIKR